MPTNRTRRRRERNSPLSPTQIAYLSGADGADLEGHDQCLLECFNGGSPGFVENPDPRELWRRHGNDFLPGFIQANPCRRPLPWWQWDAPRDADLGAGTWYAGTLPEPRRRLGGTGTPAFEVLGYMPSFHLGIPTFWVSPGMVEHYGRKGHFKGVAVDPADPPRFESEAAYLERHGLLTGPEKIYLRDHPELLAEEVIA